MFLSYKIGVPRPNYKFQSFTRLFMLMFRDFMVSNPNLALLTLALALALALTLFPTLFLTYH